MAKMSLSALMANSGNPIVANAYRHDAQAVILANTPATESEAGKVIFGMLIMYESFDRRGEQSKAMVIDQWRKSLVDWPVDVLEQAAQEWINGDKAAFVPQPGDILKTCERIGAFRRSMAKKAAELLDMMGAA